MMTIILNIQNALERYIRSVLVVVVTLNVGVVAALISSPKVQTEIDPATISQELGRAFTVPIGSDVRFPFSVHSDSMGRPSASALVLRENDTVLGPAHTPHQHIREEGGGGYSHWRGTLYFSTSDGSDPRTNGRSYVVTYSIQPSAAVVWAILILDLALLALLPGQAWNFLVKRASLVLALAVGMVAARLGAAMLGLTGPIDAAAGPPKDAELVTAILLHVALGMALTAAIFAAGAGLYLALVRRFDAPLAHLVLFGYPLGLLFAALLTTVALSLPHGDLAALGLLGLSFLPLCFWRPDRRELMRAGRVLVLALPFVFALATFMGLLWHGPTETLGASTGLGDITIYVGAAFTAAKQIFPLPSHGVEGELMGYSILLPSFIAATFIEAPGFDPFLFFSVTATVFFLLSLAICLTLISCHGLKTALAPENRPTVIVAIALLIVAAARYPSWIVESAPVPYMAPLIFSVYFIVRETRGRLPVQLAALAVTLVGSALTKVVTLAVLGPLVAVGLLRMWRGLLRGWALAASVVIGAGALAYVIIMLWTWGPLFFNIMHVGPNSWQWITVWHVRHPALLVVFFAQELGLVLLCIVAAHMRPSGLKFAVWAAVALYFVFPFLFHAAIVCAILLTALAYLDHSPESRSVKISLFGVAALLLPMVLLRDPGGIQAGVLWFACVGYVAWIALSQTKPNLAAGDQVLRGLQVRLSLSAAVLLPLAIGSVALGSLVVGPRPSQGQFTPAQKNIWEATRHYTPPDALVFTDQSGLEENRLTGWNDYSLIAQRQFYLTTWQASKLRYERSALERRVASNEAVLSGLLEPIDAGISRDYGSYYAVLVRQRPVPNNFRLVYENAVYRLYEISGVDTASPTEPTSQTDVRR